VIELIIWGKSLAIFIIALVAASTVLMIESASAQTIPKPSVPEFTLKYVVQPYYIPEVTPTYTIDPYTGEQKIQTPGSPSVSGNNRTVEIKIKNQHFTPYYDSKNNYVYLAFNVSYKGYFEDDWNYYSNNYGAGWSQANSEYVTVVFTRLPSEGQLDFRVRAQIGYYYEYNMPWHTTGFVGQSGDWSNTQTIIIPEGSVSTSTPNPSSNPTATPTPIDTATPTDTNLADNSIVSLLASLALIVVVILAISVISLLLYVRHLKRSTIKAEKFAV
jgi:hypothetical protein